MKKFNLHLYLVTDEASKCRYSLLETVRKAADGGVTMVQYRSTNPDAGTCYREALPIRDFLASRGIPFIVNNRIDLALALEADGVHIGQRDLPVPSVRAMIGPDKILGLFRGFFCRKGIGCDLQISLALKDTERGKKVFFFHNRYQIYLLINCRRIKNA